MCQMWIVTPSFNSWLSWPLRYNETPLYNKEYTRSRIDELWNREEQSSNIEANLVGIVRGIVQ